VFGLFLVCRAPAEAPPMSKKRVSTARCRPVFIHSPQKGLSATPSHASKRIVNSVSSLELRSLPRGGPGDERQLRPHNPTHFLDARRALRVPPAGNANLPIGASQNAIQENGVPRESPPVPDQCLKCRTPQNTIAMPSRSAAAITSESRTEPPG
jgi:hypothetical protein